MWPIKRIKITGHSMEPLLKDGDLRLVNCLIYKFRQPRIGEIVVFKTGEAKLLCKRISKISASAREYEMTGDNYLDSLDSKKLGLIKEKNIIGKVVV